MNKFFGILLVFLFFVACKKETPTETFKPKEVVKASDIELRFLDEYVYPANQQFKNTEIGGLSGIDCSNDNYYLVADDDREPRFYKANIVINNKKIDTVIFNGVTVLDVKKTYFKQHSFDLESILFENGIVTLSSEGKVLLDKDPTIFQMDSLGNFLKEMKLPIRYSTHSESGVRHNGTFESLTKGIDGGIWSALELPLKIDGTEAEYPTTKSPLRFTYFNDKGKAVKEFVYELSPLSREKKGNFNVNGVTDILEYKRNHFFVLERTYQNGYLKDENLVRIYKVVIDEKTTDVLNVKSLKTAQYVPMSKELIFDLSSVKSELIEENIDNIEGITFGKPLPNGNKTLILVSDDNFQKFGKQKNQFILLEIVNK